MIALISSKNQLLNLNNYLLRFEQSSSELIIVCFYENLVNEAYSTLNPNKVILIPVSPFSNPIKYLFFILRSLKLFSLKSKKIIIGDTMARYKHYILYLLNPEEIILIDDGIKSVYSFNENLNFCLPKKLSKKVSFIFTNYDLKFSNIKYYVNSFVKSRRTNIKNDIVWFIGQPLIEDKRLTIDELENYFDLTKNYFPNHEIIYFKHPRELSNYNFPKFKFIKNNEVSFEDFFDHSNYYPKKIVTFYSTSIDYCLRSSMSNIDFFFIEIKVDDRVKSIYKYLKKIGVKRIN